MAINDPSEVSQFAGLHIPVHAGGSIFELVPLFGLTNRKSQKRHAHADVILGGGVRVRQSHKSGGSGIYLVFAAANRTREYMPLGLVPWSNQTIYKLANSTFGVPMWDEHVGCIKVPFFHMSCLRVTILELGLKRNPRGEQPFWGSHSYLETNQ